MKYLVAPVSARRITVAEMEVPIRKIEEEEDGHMDAVLCQCLLFHCGSIWHVNVSHA